MHFSYLSAILYCKFPLFFGKKSYFQKRIFHHASAVLYIASTNLGKNLWLAPDIKFSYILVQFSLWVIEHVSAKKKLPPFLVLSTLFLVSLFLFLLWRKPHNHEVNSCRIVMFRPLKNVGYMYCSCATTANPLPSIKLINLGNQVFLIFYTLPATAQNEVASSSQFAM